MQQIANLFLKRWWCQLLKTVAMFIIYVGTQIFSSNHILQFFDSFI